MAATDILPLDVWPENAAQARFPANDNALRMEAALGAAIDVADSAPGAPTEGDQHIVGTTWGGFATDSIVIYKGSTWLEFAPFLGQLKRIGSSVYQFTGSAWSAFGGGGGGSAPVVTESGTSLTADDTNAGNYTRFTNAGAKTYTFDDAETYSVGDEYHGRNVGAGDLTLTEAGTFTLNAPAGGSLVISQGGTFTVKIVAADEADVFGATVEAP